MMTSMRAAPGEPLRKPSRARTIGIASAIWGVSIFLSRIMGLVREQIIGRTLGASREADLYFASLTLPDFLNYLLALKCRQSLVAGTANIERWSALSSLYSLPDPHCSSAVCASAASSVRAACESIVRWGSSSGIRMAVRASSCRIAPKSP